jgi:hypothetical protein
VRNAQKGLQNAAKNAAKRSIPGGFCSFSASLSTAAPLPEYPRRLFALQRTRWFCSDFIPLYFALHLLQLNIGFDLVIILFFGRPRSADKGASKMIVRQGSKQQQKKKQPRSGTSG